MSQEPKPMPADMAGSPPPGYPQGAYFQQQPQPQGDQARSGPPPMQMGSPPPQGAPPQGGPAPPQGIYHQGTGGYPVPMQSWGPGYPPQNQGTPIPGLGPQPAPVVCPNCRHSGITTVEYASGGFTHALAALACFIACIGCVPYFFTSLKDATHKCVQCGVPLATYHRSGRTEVHIGG